MTTTVPTPSSIAVQLLLRQQLSYWRILTSPIRTNHLSFGRYVAFITTNFHISNFLTFQAVQAFLYERFGREDSHLRIERYGFLKTVYGRKLWARSEWGTLLPLIHARMRISNEHFLTAYHAVTKPKYNALPEVERQIWDEEAKTMNEGNGTDESKAMYVPFAWHGHSVWSIDSDIML